MLDFVLGHTGRHIYSARLRSVFPVFLYGRNCSAQPQLLFDPRCLDIDLRIVQETSSLFYCRLISMAAAVQFDRPRNTYLL